MKKTSKIASLEQKKIVPKRTGLADAFDQAAQTQEVANLARSADAPNEKSVQAPDDHLVVAQADAPASDVGKAGLTGDAAPLEAGASSATAATTSTTTATSSAAATGMSFPGGIVLSSGAIAAISAGAVLATVAVVKNKSSPTPAPVIDTNAADYLAPNGVASSSIKTGATITVSTPATIAQLDAIAAAIGNTGSLSYTAVKDTAATLTAKSAYIKSGTNVQVTDSASLAQLAAFDAANGAGTLTYAAVTDTVANVAANTGGYIKTGISVTLADSAVNLAVTPSPIAPGQNVISTTAATTAQLASIDAANGSATLTYIAIADTVAALTANAGGYVKAGISVTVTDSASIAQLGALNAVATTVTATTINDAANTLVPNGAASSYITPGVNVTVTGSPSIAQLAAIAASNAGGALVYTAITDTLASLAANTGGYVTGGTVVTVNDTAANLAPGGVAAGYIAAGIAVIVDDATAPAASIAQLSAIDTANGTATVTYSKIADTQVNLTANAGGYITAGKNLQVLNNGTIANVASLTPLGTLVGASGTVVTDSIADTAANIAQNLKYLTSGTAVTVTDAASIAQMTAIDNANGAGALNYAALQDSIANLPASSTYLNSGNVVTVTVTGTASIQQLATLAAIPGVAVVAQSITDTAANLSPNGVLSIYITPGIAVTVTDPISLAELAAIDAANGTATVTYTAVADTQANLTANGLLAAGAGGYIQAGTNLTVTDVATVAQLANLDGKNGTGTVTANAITDTVTNIANGMSYVSAGTAVTLDEINGPAATVAQLTAIDTANGTGALNYTSVADTAANLSTVAGIASGYIVAGTNVTINDATLNTAASIAQLNAIDTANGIGLLTYTGVQDTIANLSAATAALYLTGGVNVRVTDAASIAQLAGLDALTGRQTVATAISDIAANLAPANTPVAHITPGATVNVTDAVTIARLAAIDAANGATAVTYATIVDTYANLAANASLAAGAAGGYINGSNANLQVLNDGSLVSAQQLFALDQANGSGTVVAANLTDTAANLAPNGVASIYIAQGASVDVTSAASIAQLAAIDIANNVNGTPAGVLTYTAVSDTIANLEPGGVASSYITPGVAVTVTGVANVVQLATLDAATVTTTAVATSISDTAANLAPGGLVNSHITTGTAVNVNVTDAINYSDLSNISALNGGGTVTYSSVILDAGNYAGALALNFGTGTGDRVQLSAAYATIDFSQFNGVAQPVIKHFEKLDMKTDVGANTVTLTAADLFAMNSDLTDSTVSNALGAAHVLVVDGSAAATGVGQDTATILAGGFALQGTANSFAATGAAGTGYSKYTASYSDTAGAHLVEVLLQQGVVAV